MVGGDEKQFRARRIIEALRYGVPSSECAQTIGCNQPIVLDQYRELLKAAKNSKGAQGKIAGLVFKGGFGCGKSHLLRFLEYLANENNFVSSHVSISKETPLHDPSKLFLAASESARIKGEMGPAIPIIAEKIDIGGSGYKDLKNWASDSIIDGRFPSTLRLFEYCHADRELIDTIVRFWSGEPLGAAYLRPYAPKCGGTWEFERRSLPMRDLGIQRFEFASRLFRAGGKAGWVILIDEAELIGCYSIFQRAKSYIEISRLLGLMDSFNCQGLITVFALTDDFSAAILEEREDYDKVPQFLKERYCYTGDSQAPAAMLGMRALGHAEALKSPGPEEIKDVYMKCKELYSNAYGWSAPDIGVGEQQITTRMRHNVRSWIMTWDLNRLYPNTSVEIETTFLKADYAETGSSIDDILQLLET